MLNCIFEGKRICALDLRDKFGEYIFEKLEVIKEASQDGRLFCEECGDPVILRAGSIYTPHFSHKHKNENCYYELNSYRETEEHIRGKELFYNYFKEKYPEANVFVNYKHYNKRRTDIYVEFSNGDKLAVEFLRKDMKLSEWKEKHYDYEKMELNDLWILSSKEYKKENLKDIEIKFFEEFMLYKSDDETIKFLNTERETLSLVKKIEFVGEFIFDKKIFSKEYKLNDITILTNGNIVCDFMKKYENEKIKHNNYHRNIELEELKRKKEIEEAAKLSYMLFPKENDLHRMRFGSSGTFEELKAEAMKSREENPKGPWYDSNYDERWGICKECNTFTKDWIVFHGIDNTCSCRKCHNKE